MAGDVRRDRVAVTADSFVVLANLAKIGLGLAMLPAFVGRKFDGLERAPQFPDGPTNKIWVATHADFRDQENIAPLIDFFVEAIRADAALCHDPHAPSAQNRGFGTGRVGIGRAETRPRPLERIP